MKWTVGRVLKLLVKIVWLVSTVLMIVRFIPLIDGTIVEAYFGAVMIVVSPFIAWAGTLWLYGLAEIIDLNRQIKNLD